MKLKEFGPIGRGHISSATLLGSATVDLSWLLGMLVVQKYAIFLTIYADKKHLMTSLSASNNGCWLIFDKQFEKVTVTCIVPRLRQS